MTDTASDRPILIIGATSGIGAATRQEALARGHTVRAFSRGAGDLAGTPRLEPFPGDARNPGDVARAVDGVSAVISALGIRERLAMLWEEETLFSDATRVLMPAMAAAGVRRLLVVTGIGAGRSRSALSLLERIGHKAILGRPYADKDRQEEMVMASDLDWTIVRPVILTNGPATRPARVLRRPAEWRNGLVSRKQVARYLVDAVEDDLDIRADVVLSR